MATNNTGKRKRASEENDKNGYSTKMDVDTVEDNLEEKSEFRRIFCLTMTKFIGNMLLRRLYPHLVTIIITIIIIIIIIILI